MVGEIAYQYPPRKYKVPEAVLRKKDNVLTIRVLCERGNGRLTPDKIYRLFSEEGSVDLTDNENCWEYKIGCSYMPVSYTHLAILRPGRFDRKISVGTPDVGGREDILKPVSYTHLQFGNKDVKVEVLDVQETVRKEEAKELFKYL